MATRKPPAAYWLLKTEPGEFSWADLQKKGRSAWDGVANNTALGHLRQMAPGDAAVIYHTGDERQAVALARIVSAAYPDPKLADPKRVVVDVEPDRALKHPVSLATLRERPLWADSPLIRIGRLSVLPLTRPQWDDLLALGDRAHP